jgi:dCTP deaminase
MTALGKKELLHLIEDGIIKIEPFDKDQIGPGSIDLRLGNKFRTFKKVHNIFYVKNDVDHREITQLIEVNQGDYFLIMPGELVHGITLERIELPNWLSGRIEGRSRLARIGLLTHLSSGYVHPGTKGKIVLEIVNVSPIPLALYPGIKICQLVIEKVEGGEAYRGRFHEQESP